MKKKKINKSKILELSLYIILTINLLHIVISGTLTFIHFIILLTSVLVDLLLENKKERN